jgi:iron complex outermembrane receptor protein
VGAFYFWQGVDTKTQIRGTGNVVLPPLFVGSEIVRDIETNNLAPFGQLTWKVTDRLRLLGGARYTMENIHADFARTNYPGATTFSPQLGGPPYTAPTLRVEDAHNFSYRLGTQFQLTPDNMAYLTYTRGYKGPAVNLLNNLSASIVDSGQAILDPEIAKNWELGVRSTLFDRVLTLNGTVFHTKFDNFQAQTFNALLNAFTLDNAGELISKGVEVEAVLVPAHGLTLSANLAYTDTEVRDFITGCYPGQTAAQGCGAGGRQDVTGSRLTNSPKWAYTVSGNYNAPLGSLPYRGVLNLTYTHRSDVFFAYRDPNTVQPGYGLLNANIGAESRDGRFRLSLFGRNLTNEHFASLIGSAFLDTSAAGAGYTQLLTTESRRTFGVEAGFRF